MALMETPCATIRVYTAGGTMFAKVTEFTIREPLTEEVANAEFIFDYKWVEDQETGGKTIEIGNSLDVYFTRGATTKYLYSGKVWDFDKPIIGHDPREMTLISRGWGDEMIGKYWGYAGTRDATIDDVIKWIVDPLVQAGKITTNNVVSTTVEINYDSHWEDQITSWDAVREVCTTHNWDFYVDKDRDLHAFPKGSLETPETFQNLITEVSFRSSGDKIINAQRIIGPSGKTIGSDADYTESATGWSTSGDTIEAINWVRGELVGGGTIDPDPDYGAGTYVIRAYDDDASGGIWMQKTFASALDLSVFGNLHFSCKYVFDSLAAIHGFKTSCVLDVRFCTDDSNYFSTQVRFPGKARAEWAVKADTGMGIQFPAYRWVYGWMPIDVPFNMLYETTQLVRVGSPVWSDINKIRITVVDPLPLSGPRSVGVLKIDDMYFDGGFFYAFSTDSTSITKYGERRGKLIYNPSLDSDNKCAGVANEILNNYAYPLPIFDSMVLRDFVDVSPGQQATITVKEITEEAMIQTIEHRLEGHNYHMTLDLSPVYIPDWDQILSDLQKFRDQQTQINLPENLNPTALFHFLTSPLGEMDVDIAAAPEGNLIKNPHFEIDSDLDGIPDNWFPSDDSIAYRTSDERRHGQFAAWLRSGKTLWSDYYPVDPSGGYYFTLWGKAKHDTSKATISCKVVYYQDTPSLTPISTHNIAVDKSPDDWTFYPMFHSGLSMPDNARWGRLMLIGESGTVGYFDDITVRQFWGVDGGQVNYTKYNEWQTSSDAWVHIWSHTWDVTSDLAKIVLTEVGCELRSTGDAEAGVKFVWSYDGTPKDTIMWASSDPTYSRYRYKGSIDPGDFGTTLVVDLYQRSNPLYSGWVRNPEHFVNTYTVVERLRRPKFFDDPDDPQ